MVLSFEYSNVIVLKRKLYRAFHHVHAIPYFDIMPLNLLPKW